MREEEKVLKLLWDLIIKNKHKVSEIYYLVLGYLGNS